MPTRLPVFWEDGIDSAQEPERTSSGIGINTAMGGFQAGFGARG
jgi:hypothetical protein